VWEVGQSPAEVLDLQTLTDSVGGRVIGATRNQRLRVPAEGQSGFALNSLGLFVVAVLYVASQHTPLGVDELYLERLPDGKGRHGEVLAPAPHDDRRFPGSTLVQENLPDSLRRALLIGVSEALRVLGPAGFPGARAARGRERVPMSAELPS